MDENIEMLNYIYQNANMGVETINQILGEDVEPKIVDTLTQQLNEYEDITGEAEELLEIRGREEKDIGLKDKIRTYFSIKMSTMKDDSASKIAKMMIQGSNMGIIDITENLNKYDDIEEDIRHLAERLLSLEQRSIEQLKIFL